MSTIEIGRRVKQIYPSEYGHMRDKDAGQAWIETHPDSIPPTIEKHLVPSLPLEEQPSAVATTLYNPIVLQDKVQTVSIPNHPRGTLAFASSSIHRLMDAYEDKGWWANLFEGSRTEYVERQAVKARALVEIQRCNNEVEVLAYLRAHNLWNIDIEAVVKKEQILTTVFGQQLFRESMQHASDRERVAATAGLSVGKHESLLATHFENTEALRVKRVETQLEFQDFEARENTTFTTHEKRERLKFELSEKEIHAEVEGTLTVANTSQLVKDKNLLLIAGWRKRLLKEKDPFLRDLYQRRVDQLTAEVFGEPSRVAGKANIGEDPEGGSTPPESGSNPQATPGATGKPGPAADSWHVN